jgi:ABC-type transporter Mla subunit MlaD
MPRYPRPSTPHPTAPPPLSSEAGPPLERLVKRVETWKAIVAILVVAAGVGATAVTLAQSKADVAELHQVRDAAGAALGAAQANTSAQLGTLQATVQDLRAHQAAVDANLAALTTSVDRLTKTADVLYIQLVEVSRATGARQVPAAPPERTPP